MISIRMLFQPLAQTTIKANTQRNAFLSGFLLQILGKNTKGNRIFWRAPVQTNLEGIPAIAGKIHKMGAVQIQTFNSAFF